MNDIKRLEVERAELIAANEAAASWGAAVGAREERIKNINSELRRLRSQEQVEQAIDRIGGRGL